MIINAFYFIINILLCLAFRIDYTFPKISVHNVARISSKPTEKSLDDRVIHITKEERFRLKTSFALKKSIVNCIQHGKWTPSPERHNSRIPLFLHSGLVESQRFASFSYRSSTTKFDFCSVSFLRFFSCISIFRATGRWGTRRKLKRFSETFLPFLNLT